jgi:hypothetical protein
MQLRNMIPEARRCREKVRTLLITFRLRQLESFSLVGEAQNDVYSPVSSETCWFERRDWQIFRMNKVLVLVLVLRCLMTSNPMPCALDLRGPVFYVMGDFEAHSIGWYGLCGQG